LIKYNLRLIAEVDREMTQMKKSLILETLEVKRMRQMKGISNTIGMHQRKDRMIY